MAWRIHFTAEDLERIQVSPTLGPLAETVMAIELLAGRSRARLGARRRQRLGRPKRLSMGRSVLAPVTICS
jgi:hypothetical protein